MRAKVEVMYPEHEIEEFTEKFWQRIQHWRADNPVPTADPIVETAITT